jgi:hypothetical protein
MSSSSPGAASVPVAAQRTAHADAPEPARRLYVAPTASAAEPAPGASALRKHALLAGLVALAAIGGGVLGAVLVLRVVARRQPVLPEPAAMAAPAASARPASAVATLATSGGKLRPELPSAPAALPASAQAIVDVRLGSLRDATAEYDTASAAFLSDGGLDASTLSTREALAARLQALEELRTRNESLRRALSALPDQVKDAATQAGLEPEVADAASRRAKADVAPQARERERDAEMQDLAGEALGVLEQSFGRWTVKDHAVEFADGADPDVAERYARVVEDSAALRARK